MPKPGGAGRDRPRFCGIDTGERCALAVRERVSGQGPVRWVYFEAPPIDRLAARCADLFGRLGVEAAVIDGGPFTQTAREVHDLLPEGCFIWRHTPGEMVVKRVAFLGVERGHVRLNREELLERIVEEFHGGPGAVRLPAPRDAAEEALLAEVDAHLMNLRVRRGEGEGRARFERNENHFAFAYAKLAEELARAEGILTAPAGGYTEGGSAPDWGADPASYARRRTRRWRR